MYLTFLFLALIPLLEEPDVSVPDLVEQLGSPQFSLRESAQGSLLKRGKSAIPWLDKAKEHADPEVRTRAVAILQEIERLSILEPSRIARWPRPIPLSALVDSLSRESGQSLRLDHVPGLENSLVAVPPPEQEMTYWGVLRYVEQSCGIRTVSMMEGDDDEGVMHSKLTFVPSRKTRNYAVDQGSFRVKLQSTSLHRFRNFDPALDEADEPESIRNFDVQLQVLSEPRLILMASAPARLYEAKDDLGNSLLKPKEHNQEIGDPFQDDLGLSLDIGNGSILTTSLEMWLPDRPGHSIKSLKGSLPISVLQRKENPLEISLTEHVGQSSENGSLKLTLKSVQFGAEDAQPSLEIEITPRENSEPSTGISLSLSRGNPAQLLEHLCSVVDAQGKPLSVVPIEIESEEDKARVRLAILSSNPSRKPTKLLFYDVIVANQELTFDFHDVPLP